MRSIGSRGFSDDRSHHTRREPCIVDALSRRRPSASSSPHKEVLVVRAEDVIGLDFRSALVPDRKHVIGRGRHLRRLTRPRSQRAVVQRPRRAVTRRARSTRSPDDPEPAPPLGRRHSRQTATNPRYAASSRSCLMSHAKQTGRPASSPSSSARQLAHSLSSGSGGRSSSTPSNSRQQAGRRLS